LKGLEIFAVEVYKYLENHKGESKMSKYIKAVIIFLLFGLVAVIASYYFFATPHIQKLRIETTARVDAIVAELQKLNIVVTGPAKQIEIQVPNELSGPNWGLKKIICEEGGYNLSSCAGKKVLFTYFPINERWNLIEPLNVLVVSDGDKIICVYKAVREDSSVAPGVFSVKNP